MAFLVQQPCTAKVGCDICGEEFTIGIMNDDLQGRFGGPWNRQRFFMRPISDSDKVTISDICNTCSESLVAVVKDKLAELRKTKDGDAA